MKAKHIGSITIGAIHAVALTLTAGCNFVPWPEVPPATLAIVATPTPLAVDESAEVAVQVRDGNGAGLNDVDVTFFVSPSLALKGEPASATALDATLHADGVARRSVTLLAGTGQHEITAVVEGLAPLRIPLTHAPAALTIARTPADGIVNIADGDRHILVQVLGDLSLPVDGVAVGLTAPSTAPFRLVLGDTTSDAVFAETADVELDGIVVGGAVRVEVVVADDAPAGEYPVVVDASTEKLNARSTFAVLIGDP